MSTGILRKLLAKDFRIFESVVWNSNGRAESKELQDMLGRLFLGETPANYGSCVLGGLACSAVAATMDSSVSPGSAMIHDTAISGALGNDSKWAVCNLEVVATATHDAAHAVNPRIDIVYATPTKGDAPGSDHDVKKHPLDGGGGVELGLATQEGQTIAIAILKGTAGATPTAPSVAALDGIPLYAVFIPALETDAANFTYADRRPGPQHARLPVNVPLAFTGAPTAGALFYAGAGDYKRTAASETPFVTLDANNRFSVVLGWSVAEELPYFFRDTTGLTGKGLGGTAYPILMQSGPTQVCSYPIRIGKDEHLQAGTIDTDYTWDAAGYGTRVEHLNAAVVTPIGSFPIPASDRGQAIEQVRVTSEALTPLTTGTAEVRLVYWDESAGALINLIDTAVHATGRQTLSNAGPRITELLALDLTLLPTTIMDTGDFLVLEIRVVMQAGDTNSNIAFWTVRVKWGEGRA